MQCFCIETIKAHSLTQVTYEFISLHPLRFASHGQTVFVAKKGKLNVCKQYSSAHLSTFHVHK